MIQVFDNKGQIKSAGSGGGGGGGATAVTKKNANNSTDSSINYCGVAVGSGISESSPVWTITKITIAIDGTVTTGTANAVAWTNRESIIYS